MLLKEDEQSIRKTMSMYVSMIHSELRHREVDIYSP